MKQQLRSGARVVMVVSIFALTGCGGGGGDPAPVVTYNVDAAFKSLQTTARSYTLTGTATNGSALTLTWTIAPARAAVFPLTNAAAVRVDSSLVVRTATQELVNGSQQAYFDNTMQGLGSVRQDGSCSQGENLPRPTAAAPGSTGGLGTAQVHATCSLSAPVINRIAGYWSLEAWQGLTFLCSNTQLLDTAGVELSRESDCVEVAPDGTVGNRARLTLDVLGTVLVFAN